MEMVIYKYKNNINGKIYIGQTCNFTKRKKQHLRSSVNIYDDFLIHKAIRKYGIENFSIDVLEYCDSKESLNDREMFYIELYKSFVKENGYNLTMGGNGTLGRRHTKEFIENLRNKMIGNEYTKGRKLSDEHKEKLSKAILGKKCPDRGRKKTEEEKIRMSEKMKLRILTKEHIEKLRKNNYDSRDRAIYKFKNINTSETIEISPYDFSKQYNVDRSDVSKLKNKKKTITKGWTIVW